MQMPCGVRSEYTLKLNGLVVNYKGIPNMDYKSMAVKGIEFVSVGVSSFVTFNYIINI